MKPLLLLLLILFGCQKSSSKKNEFHVKVECLMQNSSQYKIVFTNDNWKTTETIMTAFDISEARQWNDVVHQFYLNSKEECIKYATTNFTCYDSCVIYNKRIDTLYASLLAYRKAHPIGCDNCCTEIKIR